MGACGRDVLDHVAAQSWLGSLRRREQGKELGCGEGWREIDGDFRVEIASVVGA
jgi:hypothetical protein